MAYPTFGLFTARMLRILPAFLRFNTPLQGSFPCLVTGQIETADMSPHNSRCAGVRQRCWHAGPPCHSRADARQRSCARLQGQRLAAGCKQGAIDNGCCYEHATSNARNIVDALHTCWRPCLWRQEQACGCTTAESTLMRAKDSGTLLPTRRSRESTAKYACRERRQTA